ncbi:UDP-glucose 4-epimerase GalE [Saccharospirillum salsuginis]|uniref:UDP-glucose 4-epimerase n=1 Tax=Saccharospirillum salsuginis TaxID=418750 RepID=A0A918KEL6_9GAMM|nr:UDP-glucose 4-epimerase GalE [Saccharospirillum salsuginis]GGX60527.1 UDP-glucose 4-epimerase [Saccharospirillum salsuginis]
MTVLVTGGAGYIGSHTCIELIQAGHDILVLDNLANSSPESLRRVEAIVDKPIPFVEGDIRDADLLDRLFREHTIDSVIHFAGLKAVGESTEIPLDYYENNVWGTVNLLQVMKRHDITNIVFSSSATVYGDPHTVPIQEDLPLSATNPYGRSKLMIEDILRDLAKSDDRWQVALLRYFNPVGAHKSGTIGEDPNGRPNNLMPFITQVAIGKLPELNVFGSDYDTPDGTGVRDYIHVVDLAKGHVKAIEKLTSKPGCVAYNLGTGIGYSVLQMVKAFEEASGREVPYKLADRRPGDIACCYADPAFAERELGWKAEKGLKEMVEDSWRWQSENPRGYRE